MCLNLDSTEKATVDEIYGQDFSIETLSYLMPNKDSIPTTSNENKKYPWEDENFNLLMNNQKFDEEILQFIDSDQIEMPGIYW